MKNFVEKIVALPKWCGLCVVLIYAVTAAEYLSVINQLFMGPEIEYTNIHRFFMGFSYFSVIASSIAVWVVLSLLLHLTALLLDGEQKFVTLLHVITLPFIIPAVCMFIAILLLDDIDVGGGEDMVDMLQQIDMLNIVTWIVNGAFVLFYAIIACGIHYLYNINWIRSFLSVIIPIVSIWGVAELFSLI
ncbi:MAG: hypothetical protein HUJ96_08005 [Marinilabiliaceae bacterium]|nr:hypothetical protein [Marinilabiliaceae bacterium]